MKFIIRRLALAASLFFVALLASGHHSPAMYDQRSTVELQGVVTEFQWAYPHSYIDLRTEEEGEAVNWAIEIASPQNLTALGWTRSSLVAGDRVTVTVNPAANPDRKAALGNSLVKSDGTLLSATNSIVDTSFTATDLSGNWWPIPNPDLLFQFVRPATAWSLTEEGRTAVESFDVYLDIPSQDCVDETPPVVMLFQEMVNIELGDDTTVIRQTGKIDRIVRMNLDSHDGAQYSHGGHSIGWWEDEVLVVDTTHFSDHRIGNAFGLPSGSQKHLVERFALSGDGTALEYAFELEDPEHMTETVTGTVSLAYRPDVPFVNAPCDLDSARRYLDFVEK